MGVLDPQGGAGLQASSTLGGSGSPQKHLPMLDTLHQQSQARYAKIDKADKTMQLVRSSLDKLTSMGDAVTQDDVLDHMADLVAKGIDPKQLTSLMAGNPQTGAPPMPFAGGPLSQWLQQQDQTLQQQEQQLAGHVALSRHDMGVAAMHALVGHHVEVTHPPQGQPSAAPLTSEPSGG